MNKKLWIFISLALSFIGITILLPPISQSQSYHNFADTRSYLGIANFNNVLSNLPILLVGVYGLFKKRGGLWKIFFTGAILTGIFSGFYHLEPDDFRLAFDRMAMALVFMSFLAILMDERIGHSFIVVLLMLGIASVWYWAATGDVRFYGLVQFGAYALILALILLFPKENQISLYTAIAFLAMSKLAELYDKEIYVLLHQTISGHTLKHLFSAAALLVLAKSQK